MLKLRDMLAKYGFGPINAYCGFDPDEYVPDYGPPIVLADSSRPSQRSQEEKASGTESSTPPRRLWKLDRRRQAAARQREQRYFLIP